MSDLFAVIDATWPPAAMTHTGPWTLRSGQGGGSRVSAATLDGPLTNDAIPQAETAMTAMGQTPLFMVRDGQVALDAALARAGYAIKDPVNIYAAPVASLLDHVPPVTAFTVWPPLQAQKEIWAEGGIGDARLAVMARAKGPCTSFLGRLHDTPAGTLFVSIHDGCAMIHAVEIAAAFRGKKLGRHLTQAAARWAQMNGAQTVALLTTKANDAANGLYTSLGMAVVGHYHYRIKAKEA